MSGLYHLVLILTLLIHFSCGSGPARTPPVPFDRPNDDWPVASPVAVGADEDGLNAMIRDVQEGRYVDIHSILVVKDGVLVLEEYFDGYDRTTPHQIRSATKSIGAILVGIAIDRGFIHSEMDPIHQYFEDDYTPSRGWDERSRQVEIRHLLSMMSGYDCDDLATAFACEHAMYETDDWVQYALDLPFAHGPGKHWAYNSSSLILVGEAIARGSGMQLDQFAERFLFAPLGIREMHWSVSPKGRAWIGGGARMAPREMAKIGLLVLNHGRWNGSRIVSEEWIEKITARQGEMHGGADYGYLWQSSEALLGNRMIPAHWASGNGGQYIIVLPDDGMVVVFTGGNYNDPLSNQPFRMLVRNILPAFLEIEPLEEIELSREDMRRLEGVYELDFERSATSTITVRDGQLRILTPDDESLTLTANSPLRFSGGSARYGSLTLLFQADERGDIARFVAYGSFSRFTFVRRKEEGRQGSAPGPSGAGLRREESGAASPEGIRGESEGLFAAELSGKTRGGEWPHNRQEDTSAVALPPRSSRASLSQFPWRASALLAAHGTQGYPPPRGTVRTWHVLRNSLSNGWSAGVSLDSP